MSMITTKSAATVLRVSERRIRQLITSGKIEAEMVGRDWIIKSESLKDVKVYGKSGRPKKQGGGVLHSK